MEETVVDATDEMDIVETEDTAVVFVEDVVPVVTEETEAVEEIRGVLLTE